MVDDPAEQPVVRPAKKRRNNATSNDIGELAIAIREDMESQRRDRQTARKLDSDFLEVLRDFFEKQWRRTLCLTNDFVFFILIFLFSLSNVLLSIHKVYKSF